jgi:hypothetical protein
VTSLHSHLVDATIEQIRLSLHRHMPISQQRDFYLWGISPDNRERDNFLQMMGVMQLIKLSASLLDGLVKPEHWPKLAKYAGQINAYFLYEIVSDDLAIGLSPLATGDTGYPLRREILFAFNYVMNERLNGEPTHTTLLLEPLEHFSRHISGFTQSMTQEKHKALLDSYLRHRRGTSPLDIEYAIWPALVANIESCRELVESMHHLQIGELLRQGFVNRYQSVTQLLEAFEPIPLPDLIYIGTHTVSVIPVLCYFTGVVGEIIEQQSRLPVIIENGLLSDALATAAIMVRLLNDIGTPLILSTQERESMLQGIRDQYRLRPDNNSTITELIINAAIQDERLTRFHKDTLYGEFNVCLNNLAYTSSVDEGLALLEANLAQLTHLYHESQQHLEMVLKQIDDCLNSTVITKLIARFVGFHQQIYAQRYNTPSGEYVA